MNRKPRAWNLGHGGVLALAGLLMGSLLLWLAWVDVLPGGWTLRGWVEPHEQRAERARLEYEAERLEQFQAARDSARPGSVFLGGSSTIERFPYAWFEGGHLLNRGINDEPSEHFLVRFEASLPSAPVSAAVLYMASVDFRRLLASPETVAERVRAILERVQSRLPECPILLLGIYPEQNMPAGWAERLEATNQKLAELCRELGVDFLSTQRPPLIDSKGDLAVEYAADLWHLNQRGYAQVLQWLWQEHPVWAGRLQPLPGTPGSPPAQSE